MYLLLWEIVKIDVNFIYVGIICIFCYIFLHSEILRLILLFICSNFYLYLLFTAQH